MKTSQRHSTASTLLNTLVALTIKPEKPDAKLEDMSFHSLYFGSGGERQTQGLPILEHGEGIVMRHPRKEKDFSFEEMARTDTGDGMLSGQNPTDN